MKKTIIGIMLLSLIMGCSTLFPTGKSPNLNSTMYVVSVFRHPEIGLPMPMFGTGIVVKATKNDSFVLTNAHVCGVILPKIGIFTHKKEEFIAKIVKKDINTDLCLAKIENKVLPSVKIANKMPPIHTPIYSIGHPKGTPFTKEAGYLSLDVGDKVFMWNNLFSTTGSSGSGVFMTSTDELVGIISQAKMGTNLSGMIRLEVIKEFIKDVE